MTDKPQTAKRCPHCGYTKEDAQTHMDHHLCKQGRDNPPWKDEQSVTLIERWVPAKDGEPAPIVSGSCGVGFTPMKLEGRYINGKRI